MADSTSKETASPLSMRGFRLVGHRFEPRTLLGIAILAVCYYAAAKLALFLAISPGHASAVWPASGIALAALMLFGVRLWPGIWLAAAAVNYGVGASWSVAAGIAFGNTVEAILAWWLVRRLIGERAEFERPESAFRFVAAVAVCAIVAAAVGVLVLFLDGRVQADALLVNGYTWWQGDAAGMIVLTPFVLAWLRPARRDIDPQHRAVEIALFFAALLAGLLLVLALVVDLQQHLPSSLAFLLIPFVVWAGCRYNERVVTATIVLVAAGAIWSSLTERPAGAGTSLNEALLILQAFISTVALMGLVLCALTRRRAEAVHQLQQAGELLEVTVAERTMQLEESNRELARDLDERVRLAEALQRREAQLAEAQALTHIGSWNLNVATGRVTWSDELFRIFAVQPSEFAGTLEAHLAHFRADDGATMAHVVERARASRAPWEATHRIQRGDGAIRLITSVGDVWTGPDGEVTSVYGACIDVTEATRRQRMQDVQQQVTDVLVRAPSWPDAMVHALQIVCEKLDWALGQMWAVDDVDQTLSLRYAWASSTPRYEAFIEASRQLVFRPGHGLPGRVWKGVAPQWIEDVPSDPTRPRAAHAQRCGLRGALCFPLTAGQRILGVLEFFSEEPRRPEDELLQALVALGSQLGEYIVRNRAESLLRESEERFRLLIDGVKDYAIVMLDLEGNISTWNAGAARINGYASEEVLGQHFSRFYTAEDSAQGKPDRLLAEAVRTGSVEDESWRLRKDGSLFWANVVLTALYDAGGQLRGFAKVTRDMTERKQMEALEEAGRQTRQFLAMLGHELRNPLAPIRNAVGVMSMREIDDPQIAYCRELIGRQVTHLARLVDDLLDASRITSGMIGLHTETLELGDVIARAIEASRPLMEQRSQQLSVIPSQQEIVLNADRTRLVQVVQNLLNNAAKYTPRGGHIELRLTRDERHAVIQVRDDGMGISPELLPKIFDLFMQADGGLARTEGGLGVGLALARRIVELHGGSIEGFSEGIGRGAAFAVRLPIAQQPPAAKAEAQPEAMPARASKSRRVLVVDDNNDAADSVAELLRLRGHGVSVAYDGRDALAIAGAHAPQVVLLDIGLPGMDGYEVAVRLRQLASTHDSLIVALTGYGQMEDRRRSEAASFDGHLVKPVDVQLLYQWIEEGTRRAN